MNNCLFCQIVAQEIPCKPVFESELILAFEDVAPKCDTHILVIPKKHLTSLAHLHAEDAELLGELTTQLKDIAKLCGLDNGFRTIINTGEGGGQEIPHLHYHLLGGHRLPTF